MQESIPTTTRDIRKLRSEGRDVSSQKKVHIQAIHLTLYACTMMKAHSFEGGIVWHFAMKKGRWHLVCQSYCGFPYYRILFRTIYRSRYYYVKRSEFSAYCYYICCYTYARIMQCSIYFIYTFHVVCGCCCLTVAVDFFQYSANVSS